jgi:hypothetical protein
MRALLAAAISVAVLGGCAEGPAPYLSCEDMPTADCEAAHEEALTNGLFLDGSEQVTAALVRPAQYRFCNSSAEPFADVSFTLAARSTPLVVSVGRTDSGSLVVCTY